MTSEILLQILLGGLLGIAGQILRIIVGMKKLNDDAKQQQTSVSSLINTSRMVISILIGFCAGVLAVVTISTFKNDFFSGDNTKQNILAIIAAGYSGTDFIEGLISKYLPNTPNENNDAYKNAQPTNNIKQVAPPAPGPISHPIKFNH